MKNFTWGSARRSGQVGALLLGTALSTGLVTGAAAETLTVTGITTPAGSLYTLSVPSVEVVDGNIDEATVRALFTGAAGDSLAKLATLDAASVHIPEISMTVATTAADGSPLTSTTTYRNLVFTNVVDGVAASTSVDGMDVAAPEGTVGKLGPLSTGRFDMAALLGFYGLGGVAPSSEMKSVYDDFRFEGGSITADGVTCDIGTAHGDNFSARPLKTSLADLQVLTGKLQAAEASGTDPEPETVKGMLLFYADFLEAIQSSPFEFTGLDCNGKIEGADTTFAFGPLKIDGFQPAVFPAISTGKFTLDSADTKVKFDDFTVKPIDFAGPIAAIKANSDALTAEWFAANWRKLIPAMDGLSVTGLDVDVPDEQNPGQRTTATVGKFELALADYVNGIPSRISMLTTGSRAPLPAEVASDPYGAALVSRGITEILSDSDISLHWDKAAGTIVVDNLMLDVQQLGRVALSGTFGNATEALFNADEAISMQAAQALTLKQLSVDIVDRGGYGIVTAVSAQQSSQPEAAFIAATSGMAQGMTLAVLGNSDDALVAAQQLGKFLSGTASHLKLTLNAKNPAGLGIADVAGLEQNPTLLAGKLTVVAEADGDPVAAPAVVETPAADSPATDTPVDGQTTPTQQEKLGLKAPPAAQ